MRPIPIGATIAITIGLITGCGTEEAAVDEPAPTPHGYVEGAEETSEAQHRIAILDQRRSHLDLLDPATEETVPLGEVPQGIPVGTDGRYVYLSDGDHVTVVDTGVWTVDHGDHVHYYRAEPRNLGTVEVSGVATVTASASVTVLSGMDGAVVLDRSALDDGEVTALAAVASPLVAAHGRVLLAADSAGVLSVLDHDGTPIEETDVVCPGAREAVTTAHTVVVRCDDEVVIVRDGAKVTTSVGYPVGVGEILDPPGHRADTPVFVTDSGRVLALDAADETWTVLSTDDAVTAVAAGDGGFVLVLTADGLLRSFDAENGTETAVAEQSITMSDDEHPSIEVIEGRAYLADSASNALLEFDYRDGMRLSRTIGLSSRPDAVVGTGW